MQFVVPYLFYANVLFFINNYLKGDYYATMMTVFAMLGLNLIISLTITYLLSVLIKGFSKLKIN